MTTSQAVHHGQEVVSFAAGSGRLISRLCKLSHDLGKLRIGLLVLKVIHQSQNQIGYHKDLYLITVNPVRLVRLSNLITDGTTLSLSLR